ncbi:MAG: hypothetical protein ACJAU6_004053 [Alphaproteobacteria bacterium]|jgi:hypothetical protein
MLNQNADTFTVKDFTLSDSVVMPKRCCLIILASGSSPPSLEIHTGSYLAFQWCVSHAQRMHELIPVASRPQGSGDAAAVAAFEAIFYNIETWNGGHHYGREPVFEAVRDYRAKALRNDGIEQTLLADIDGDVKEALQILIDRTSAWTRQFDPNPLIAPRQHGFNVMIQMSKIEVAML